MVKRKIKNSPKVKKDIDKGGKIWYTKQAVRERGKRDGIKQIAFKGAAEKKI